jgi:hypothetical protein
MIPPKYETMKIALKIKTYLPLWLMLMLVTQLSAQQMIEGEKMKFLENKVLVNNTPQEVWKALVAFGNVSTFHSTIDESIILNGSAEEAMLGAEREIQIPDGVHNIINKEKIIKIIEGIYYTYDVYESENFPIKKMQVTYGVRLDHHGRTVLYSKTFFKFNNALANGLLKKKLDRANKDSLLAYKNYIENGEKNTNIKELRKRYEDNEQTGDFDYLVSHHILN